MGKKNNMKGYQMGGFVPSKDKMTSGDGDSFVSPDTMSSRDMVDAFASNGGLMGMGGANDIMAGDTLGVYKRGGGTSKGGARKGKKPGSRLAYD